MHLHLLELRYFWRSWYRAKPFRWQSRPLYRPDRCDFSGRQVSEYSEGELMYRMILNDDIRLQPYNTEKYDCSRRTIEVGLILTLRRKRGATFTQKRWPLFLMAAIAGGGGSGVRPFQPDPVPMPAFQMLAALDFSSHETLASSWSCDKSGFGTLQALAY